ncbi:MAG: VanZ family protein [Agathobacter rectalis]
MCGFGFALFIEVVQLITGRGVFETDDIINNTIGAMIGYGLFSVARLIFVAVCSRKKVQDNIQMKSVECHMMKMFVKDRTFP